MMDAERKTRMHTFIKRQPGLFMPVWFWLWALFESNLFKLSVHTPGVRNEGGACDHCVQRGTAVTPEEKD